MASQPKPQFMGVPPLSGVREALEEMRACLLLLLADLSPWSQLSP